MANLYVTITEEITLPNTTTERTNVFKTISGINQVARRVDTIPTTFVGNGVEILSFCNSEEEQTGGAFVKSAVEYIRITSLSTQYNTLIYLIANDGTESAILSLDPGKTIALSNADIDTPSNNDYVIDGYVDETYYSNLTYINSIKAKAISGSTQLEYFVAST
jgi:hypothetical protein